MIREALPSDFEEILKIADIDADSLTKSFDEKHQNLVYISDGEIQGYSLNVLIDNSYYIFNLTGDFTAKKALLRETLKKLGPKNQICALNLYRKDSDGAKIAKAHHFVKKKSLRAIDVWFHRYHPDNFYYPEVYIKNDDSIP